MLYRQGPLVMVQNSWLRHKSAWRERGSPVPRCPQGVQRVSGCGVLANRQVRLAVIVSPNISSYNEEHAEIGLVKSAPL